MTEAQRQSRMDVLTPIILLVGGLLIPVLGWADGVKATRAGGASA